MPEAHDFHTPAGRVHAVDNAVGAKDHLAQIRLVEFRNHATALGQGAERHRGVQQMVSHALSRPGIMRRDVRDDAFQVA